MESCEFSHPSVTWAKVGPNKAIYHGVWMAGPSTLCGRQYYPLRRPPWSNEHLCTRCEIIMWTLGVRPQGRMEGNGETLQLPLRSGPQECL